MPGGTVAYENAAVEPQTFDDGSVLLTFSNSTEAASFTLSDLTSLRILAIGGGGGGGGLWRRATATSSVGAGGGGGAGGFVEVTNLYGAATYAVSVGAGGPGADNVTSSTAACPGSPGGDTTITTNGVAMLTAPGGGGGGGQGPGASGASGGGGSRVSSTTQAGGTGNPGFDGGKGDAAVVGGGGGGAGGAGQNALAGGAGGAGRTSDITGEGFEYAAGGGGGKIATKTNGATAELPGSGGGGAGDTSTNHTAADGKPGIVYVRIMGSFSGERPKDSQVEFDGKGHYPITPSPFLEIEGVKDSVSEVGVYTARAKPIEGLTWLDGSSDWATATLVIYAQASITGTVDVTGAPVSFFGAATNFWVYNPASKANDLVIGFSRVGTFTLPGTSSARILAIGGGGGGGGLWRRATATSNVGAGGGGGAGGFVEVTNRYEAATYTVSVGAGGPGADNVTSSTAACPGSSGAATTIATNGVAVLTAPGGGGGGGQGPGASGASGGGGSRVSNTPQAGGTGNTGFDGGKGDAAVVGGGGGGAGGAGQDALEGGAGGAGRTSDITGEGFEYAAGGGGGKIATKTNGATAESPGSGGGGAGDTSTNHTASNGLAGVVYIRISSAMVGPFKKPDPMVEFTYDRNAHTSIVDTAFYTIGGDNVGTNAGEYTATATLKPTAPDWPEGGREPATVTMTIKPRPTTFSNLHLDDWEFGTEAEKIPEPSCTVDPEWVTPNYEWRVKNDELGGWQPWSEGKPKNVGEYELRVGAPTDGNYAFEYATTTFRITKVHVTFSNLIQRDWMEGTPDEAVPSPTCDVVPEWVLTEDHVRYEWKAKEEGEGEGWKEWSKEKPKVLGEYVMRVRPENDDDYACDLPYLETTFRIVKGLGGLFIDYVEIKLDGYHAGGELTNFPYQVALDEPTYDARGLLKSGLPGFLYSRAGEKGDELAFTDDDGNVLDYKIGKWDDRGESTLIVRIPRIGSEPQTIRLYWYLRPGATAPDHHPTQVYSDWTPEEAEVVQKALSHEFDLVSKGGYFVNYWVEKPTLSETVWSVEDGKAGRGGVLSGEAKVKDGATVVTTLTDVFSGEAFTFDAAKTNASSYRITYVLRNPEPCAYEDLRFAIDFCVTTRDTFDDLTGGTGSLTLGGRVMLANDDVAEGHEVKGQGYWQTDPTLSSYWVHEGTHSALSSYLPNVASHQGTSHRLYGVFGGQTNLLWRFESVVIGNGFTGDSLSTLKNYLPNPQTGVSIKSAGSTVTGNKDGAGQIILRNTRAATVYSPCYTNGIGTIYFDAVNFRNDFTGAATAHRIAVEIATETDDGLPPTDENACNPGSDDLAKIHSWTRCSILPLKRESGVFTNLTARTKVDLDVGVPEKGGSLDNFYRLCVPVNTTKPVRFRIVRLEYFEKETEDGDGIGDGYILLDNMIVSPGPMSARMEPLGVYDDTKRGKQAIGWEGGRSVPFPSVTDKSQIYLGGRAVCDANGMPGVEPETFLQLARLWYRDRYLNQRIGEWKKVDLSPANGFRASDPLDLERGLEGDVEFWYESFTKIPAYDYYDYSGADPERKTKLGGLYREETSFVTNRIDLAKYNPPRVASGGSDFYFRFRAGVDDWSGCTTVLDGQPYAMELIGDHLWRALVKLPKDLSGEMPFHFAATNRFTAWGEAPVEATRRWCPTLDVTKLPFRGETNTRAPAGKTVAVDGASGYLEFQFNDETGLYSVGHAEYQEFSGWNDAKIEKPDGSKEWFKGSTADTSGVNTVEQILTNAHMNTWALWNRSLTEWNERFILGSYIGDEASGYPKYTQDYLSTHAMPQSWDGANGIFVDEQMTQSNLLFYAENSGIAWQMQGKGKGSVSYTRGDGPSGLDEVTFRARLAQKVTFADFAAMEGDGATKKNATLLFPAAMSVSGGGDLSPNASMSIVGYYRASQGCYEFRVTKRFTNGLLLELYKWTLDDETDEMAATCLGSVWYSGATFEHNEGYGCVGTPNTRKWPKAFGFFLSIDTTVAGRAKILAGLSQSAYDPSAAEYNGTDSNGPVYRALEAVDDENPLEKGGAFGVLSTDCNGIFIRPVGYDKPVGTVTGLETAPAGSKLTRITNRTTPATKIAFDGTKTEEGSRIKDEDWNFTIAREQRTEFQVSNTKTLWGLTVPADLKQTVGVYLKPRTGSGGWTLREEKSVTSFSLAPYVVQVRTNADVQVMLKTGKKATDVTVHTITQNAWNGEDISNIGGISEDFVYTQACITNVVTDGATAETKVTNRVTCLVPARAMPGKPVSVRSPILKGLGMVGFSYRDVKPGCRILVQVATNDVRRSLAGTGGYNTSTNCVPFGGEQTVGTWMTIRAYDADELGESGEQTYYLGWHDRKGDPLEGVFRVTIDPGVVMDAARWGQADPGWGSVTLTDVYVRDEPPIDDRSWLGWNLRVLGDGSDEERRMYLPDMFGEGGIGNSAALNDSYRNIDGTVDQFDKNNPYIQSPTFGSYVTPSGEVRRATVGQIRFRARLYETNAAALKTATVSLYGAKDGAAVSWGDPIHTWEVKTRDFTLFEYKAPAGTDYAAMRLVIDGVTAGSPDAVRVLFDEIVVSEKSDSKVGFVYARPFRTGLGDDWVVEDILDKSQQPLAGESWGVQTQLRLDQLANDIDVDRGFRVTLQYHEGIDVWGWQNWAGKPGSSEEVDLVQVGSRTNLIFRSTASDPKTVVPPTAKANETVQYVVTVYYYQRGSDVLLSQPITAGEWTNPEWYEPVDLNADYDDGSGTRWSPYTILESVAPGRVWINEANFNDGDRTMNRGYDSVTNQFVEIAVPWGVDLTGWELYLTDVNKNSTMLARFGEGGVPAVKQRTAYASDRYEFFVLVSPKTAAEGGVADPGVAGRKVMDATWTGQLPNGTFPGQTMMYEEPYQFELRRPSGIVEHQFVVGGTNELRGTDWEALAYLYDGTNLVNELNEIAYSAKRFYAGDDLARKPDGRALSSFGVLGAGHGEEGLWSAEKGLTPGRLNEDQAELANWWIDPLGGAVWIYAQVLGGHLVQTIGDDTKPDTFFVVNSGSSTSIQYRASAWYGIGALTVNGVTNTEATGLSTYTLNLNNVTETTVVVAQEGLPGMLIDAGLDPSDRYAPAVQKWLADRTAAGTLYSPEGPIVLGRYKGLQESDTPTNLTLTAMYWLDMDPTRPGWWLRGDMTDIEGTEIHRKRVWNEGTAWEWTEHYTNRQVTVKLYLTNETYWAKDPDTYHAPYRLQGLGNEQSDTFTGAWTSETFQVMARLNNGLKENAGFLPFRCFIFNKGSFAPKGSEHEFESVIEILDPFSQSSPGQAYGWSSWRGTDLWFRWGLGDVRPPAGVDTLKAVDTYDGDPYEDDD